MININKIELIGRLGKDPETREVGTHTKVGATLATTESWKVGDEWKEETQWHQLVAWNKVGEQLAKMKKGHLIYIEGKVKYRKYSGTDGVEKYITEIDVQRVGSLQPKEQPVTSQPVQQPQAAKPNQADDLPF